MNEDKQQQIEAILNGRCLDFACKKLGVTHMARNSYSEVFDVSKNEIREVFEKSELPHSVYTTDRGFEGLHFIKEESEWKIYWKERGERYSEEIYTTEQEAKENLLEWLLRTSGCGLDFGAEPAGRGNAG